MDSTIVSCAGHTILESFEACISYLGDALEASKDDALRVSILRLRLTRWGEAVNIRDDPDLEQLGGDSEDINDTKAALTCMVETLRNYSESFNEVDASPKQVPWLKEEPISILESIVLKRCGGERNSLAARRLQFTRNSRLPKMLERLGGLIDEVEEIAPAGMRQDELCKYEKETIGEKWLLSIQENSAAGHWVANNSGSIAQAASVIAQVAGTIALNEDDLAAEGDNVLPTLKTNLDKAETKLLGLAVKHFPQPTVPADSSLKVLDFAGLWPTPSSAKDPKVIPEISIDINKLVAYNRVPASAGSGVPVDIGEAVANQLFNPPTAPNASDSELQFDNVAVTFGDGSSIAGGMIFYQIPLGNPGTYKAWHSHIRLYYISSASDQKAIRGQNLALSIKQSTSNKTSKSAGGSFNAATLSVQWNGSRGVDNIMSTAVQDMLNRAQGEVNFLPPAVKDRTRFKYQFQTSPDKDPAEVAAALSSSIGVAMGPPNNQGFKLADLHFLEPVEWPVHKASLRLFLVVEVDAAQRLKPITCTSRAREGGDQV